MVGSDTNKSVRTIASEEIAALLIPSTAQSALDTLEEIAAWIQDHPSDIADINAAIQALESKTELGTYDDNGVDTEYATVKDYVEAVLGDISVHTHSNYDVLAAITASDVSAWDAAASISHSHVNAAILDDISAADISGWNEAASKAHDHDNIDILNAISASDISAWEDAVNLAHSHANETVLNGISATDVSTWDYIGTNDLTSGTLRYRVAQLESATPDEMEALTASEIDAIINPTPSASE